jgi:hypothetical protein
MSDIARPNNKAQALIELVVNLSKEFTLVIDINTIKASPTLWWGGNGVGDRWANKKFNYSVIYKTKAPKLYAEPMLEPITYSVPQELIAEVCEKMRDETGIIGIYVHSKRTGPNKNRAIRPDISTYIRAQPCVMCGSNTDIVCDHKNDCYNDMRVLNIKTQTPADFQPLCLHCNLQKRNIYKKECDTGRLYSAKNIARYTVYPFEFPWEKKAFDIFDIRCKEDTVWYDPIEFERVLYKFVSITRPLNQAMLQAVQRRESRLLCESIRDSLRIL